MSWATVHDALRAWVRDGSGLPDGKVIWADQTGPRPALPFADLRIGSSVPLGAVDEVSDNTDLGRPAGEEIEMRAQAVQEFYVTVRLFTAPTLDDSAARALLGRTQLALALPTKRSALALGGVTVFDRGEVQNLSAVKDAKFEGRAMLVVGCYTIESLSEYVGYIETVEAENFMGPPASGTRDEIDLPVPDAPAGAALYLHAHDTNGSLNAGLGNGSEIAAWKNKGSAADGVAPSDFYAPHLKANSAYAPLVHFDGVWDRLDFAGSAASLAFLHNTGVFDLLLVLRRHSSGYCSLFGNSGTTASKGLYLAHDETGKLNLILLRGTAGVPTVNFLAATPAPVGELKPFLIRCDGASAKLSTDLQTFGAATAFTASLAAGDATNSFQLGYVDTAGTGGFLFNGDVALLAIWPRNLSTAELADMKRLITVGFGV